MGVLLLLMAPICQGDAGRLGRRRGGVQAWTGRHREVKMFSISKPKEQANQVKASSARRDRQCAAPWQASPRERCTVLCPSPMEEKLYSWFAKL